MAMHLVFWKLEWKRAWKRLPQMLAGATVLLFLAASVAFLADGLLYGDAAAGRITVGVVMPEEELLTKKAISMVGSLDSVSSMCDFRTMSREEAQEGLKDGSLLAVMEIPEQLIEGIMDGSNPPVRVLLPVNAGAESRIFRELTEAGAKILGSAQAGIYAGGELCQIYGLETSVLQLEEELNRIFLSYSLPREDYFRYFRVSATGDIDTLTFYGISAYVVFLLLSAVPASGYLLPWNKVMKQKLRMTGIRSGERAAARVAGLATLYLAVTAGIWGVAWAVGRFPADGIGQTACLAVSAIFVCLAAAALVTALYQLAGTMPGGIMLVFLIVTAGHFLAGGFLPLVFLPASIQAAAPFMPSSILMDGVRMIVTGSYEWAVFGKLCLMTAAGVAVSAVLERREA